MPGKTNVVAENEAIARIDREREEAAGITTDLASWGSYREAGTGSSTTVEGYVAGCLGEWAEEYDTDAIAREFSEELNTYLPEGITLAGREFYGPYHNRPHWDGRVLGEAIEQVDFWAIAEKYKL